LHINKATPDFAVLRHTDDNLFQPLLSLDRATEKTTIAKDFSKSVRLFEFFSRKTKNLPFHIYKAT
jgi:hypothetical protein